MNDEDVRRIVREEVHEILDTEVWDIIFELINGQEAGITAFKERLRRTKLGWNPSKIKWTQAQGVSGSYERSEDFSNQEFKAMLKDLTVHGGKLTREGWFYWVFKNGTTVGRKRRKKAENRVKACSDPAQLFPDDLRSLLSFEKEANAIIIKPRGFLGSENFAKIADIVKRHSGKWVSAGKESHFKIQLKGDVGEGAT